MPSKTTPSSPTVAVFDFGGVLVDWNPRHLYRKLIPDPAEMERFLAEVTTRDWHTVQDHGGDPAVATRQLQALHPGKEALIAAFYDRFDEMNEYAFPEMAALVEQLHEAGTPLYLLSNAPNLLDPWLRGPARERHPFLGLFRDYVVSGLVGHSKPNAEIYELVCRTGSFEPADAVFIDDVLANVEGARAAGMTAIHHRTPEETATELRALGFAI
ncbi:2-haloacid dehalogenase [Enhydrobacter aerosaccus]|uniref:2-haloacid dehalogenase n=1 Tax=Enhydrobacter aerosaccus TaxID=225324 RepID=A0A1T4S096_9HYPH|nr:HAD family phosphatase [Enhydrobacter aerosaccus]SKA21368.1 2-haloacid dehalogenase [Enhydrobacter aerosaccus]